MRILRTRQLTPEQFAEIERLWDSEYPAKLAGRFPLLLDGVARFQHHLILDEAEKVQGWAVEFEKDAEMRFSIIVPSVNQGKGYGVLLINSLKDALEELYGWVIDHDRDLRADGSTYRSPLGFYRKHNFTVLEDQRIEAEIISAVKIKWSKPAHTTRNYGTEL